MTIKILTGEDVTNTYKYPSNYTQSSMTGEELGEHTRFYEDNPDKVGIIACYNDNGIMISRGLIWTCDNGTKIIDVIYGSKKGIYEIFDWADDNNILSIYDRFDKNIVANLKITMKIKRDTLPYVDTFYLGELSEDQSEVILSCYPNDNTNVMLTSHEGYCYLYEKNKQD